MHDLVPDRIQCSDVNLLTDLLPSVLPNQEVFEVDPGANVVPQAESADDAQAAAQAVIDNQVNQMLGGVEDDYGAWLNLANGGGAAGGGAAAPAGEVEGPAGMNNPPQDAAAEEEVIVISDSSDEEEEQEEEDDLELLSDSEEDDAADYDLGDFVVGSDEDESSEE